MKKNALLCAFLTFFLALSFAMPSFAAKAPLLVDEAALLSEDDFAALEEKLEELSAKWENDIAIVTVNSIGGQTPEAFADDWFDYNGYGQGESHDGLLLLLNMGERDWHISTHGYAITVFTDYGIQSIGEQMIANGLSDGDYAGAFHTFADECDLFFAQALEGEPYDNYDAYSYDAGYSDTPQERTPSDYFKVLAICFGMGVLIALFVVGGMKRQLKSVRMQHAAADYLRPGSMQMHRTYEQFLHKRVTKVYNPPAKSSSSGGGSSTHTSSSGRSHGGGGGKF